LVDVGAEQVSFPVPANFGIVAKQGETLQEPVKLLDKPEFVAFPEQQTLLVDAVAKTVAPVLIEWQPVAQASGFQLNILADDLSDSKTEKLLKSYRTQEHQLNLNELSIGCYQLSLRAIDNLGLHGLAEQKRLCLNQQISTPLVNSKPSDLPEEPQVKITWDPSDDASMYRVELSNMQDFSTLLSSVNTIETSTMITRQDTELFVRVQAIGEHENYSNFSQSVWIPAQVRVEENDGWKVFIPIGLFLLGFL
jgi:predicted phage tail protein